MRFDEIYKAAVKLGMASDPRSKRDFDRVFSKAKEELKKGETVLDGDSAWNPYSDTRVLYGGDRSVRKVMVGVDVDTGELMLADKLRSKGVDGVVAHHPLGRGALGLPGAMEVQKDWLGGFGVPTTVADGVLSPRIGEVERSGLPSNHMKTVDSARLLDMPLMCIHSAADMLGQAYAQKLMDENEPYTVKDVIDALLTMPEYRKGREYGLSPKAIVGSDKDRCGKVAVKFAGGTSFGKETYKELASAHVGTVVCMHAPDNHLEEAKKHHVRIVISGHMPSDSLGLNLLCDHLKAKGLAVVPFSGFLRHKRRK